ncbi:unnamed protein product [Rotaria magnacalcarata]|nr:unnamed protein product [Rotaria magnacalcarata]CAF2125928.1 unnamed protein product [Rotaria magnacalcarata]CAF2141143.1 unnamed protein product [Rotaria magnacalcarata]
MHINDKIIIPGFIVVVLVLIISTAILGVLYGIERRETKQIEKGIWTSIINPITYSQSSVEKLLNQGGYVMISAGRNNKLPSDQNLSDETIRERTVNLTIDLTNTYVYSSMFGVYNGDNETSFFVILHNISPDTERNVYTELGKKYNQQSIIYVKRATPTIQQLIYTTGEFSGKYVEGQGYKVLSTNITDDYSELNVCPDNIFRFTLNFNFEIMIMGNTRIKTRQLIDHHTNYILANRKRQTSWEFQSQS